MKRLIIFLIRKKLGVKTKQKFRFTNQKSDAFYYFTKDRIMKESYGRTTDSNVRLNWLLDDECKVIPEYE